MNVAVLTLTRDRLAYSQHCFQRLRDNAGIAFDWFVLDQGSTDGTPEWLADQDDLDSTLLRENIGISRALNLLLDEAVNPADYDVIVKIDNDCELVQQDTLRGVCELVMESGASVSSGVILSPRILGLNSPPPLFGEFRIGDTTVLETAQIGGVFLAAPASLYTSFRFNEGSPVWGLDDTEICAWHRSRGGRVGYVAGLEAWHYESTASQHARYPEYFARTLAEGKPAL